MNRAVLVPLLLLGCGDVLHAGDDTRRRLEADVGFLADDRLEGRGSPGRGLDVAAAYIESQLVGAGFAPAFGGSYRQVYALMSFDGKAAAYDVSIGGVALSPSEYRFVPFAVDPERGPFRYPLVFLGWGVDEPERGVTDFAGVDVRDRAVLALEGAPWPVDPTTPFGSDHAIGKAIATTVRNGALTVYVSDDFLGGEPSAEFAIWGDYAKSEIAFLREFRDRTTSGLGPILLISPAAFDRALATASGRTYAQWQALLGTKDRPRGALTLAGAPAIEIGVRAPVKAGRASNVGGVLRGTDPALRSEWVALTAHYDHMGTIDAPGAEDRIYNGADDNASGTAALLEIARRLGAGPPPKRSVLMLFVSAEERGLVGSAWYSRHPVVPMPDVAVNINVDMIGRSDGSVQAITHNSDALFERARALGGPRRIEVKPDQQPSWKLSYLTDSYHFKRFDVPSVEFFTGVHADYHQPSDEADRIRYDELTRITDLVAALAGEYAQGAPRPAVHRPAWFLTPE